MGVTNYLSIDGQIVSEHRSGEARSRDYVLDPFGNVMGVYQADWAVAYMSFDPWGERVSGWNDSSYKFAWAGGWGYRQTNLEWSTHYVRARHYSFMDGGWTTVDPLWPQEPAYRYVGGRVGVSVDPMGQQEASIEMARQAVEKACHWSNRLLANADKTDAYGKINNCVRQCPVTCQSITRKMLLCLSTYACNNTLRFNEGDCCEPNPPCAYVEAPGGIRQGGCTKGPTGVNIFICKNASTSDCNPLRTSVPVTDAVLHELLHCCGLAHGSAREPWTCNSIMTCCLLKHLGINPPGHRCC